MKRHTKRVVIAISALVLGLTIWMALPTTQAEAAQDAQQDNPLQELADERLALLYERMKLAQQMLDSRLRFAGHVVATVEQWIDRLQEQGVDTAELEAALDAYEAGIDTAADFSEQAADILAEGAGFDENGHVIDRALARETIRTAGQAIRDGNRTLTDAQRAFRHAVAEWRRAHRQTDLQRESG